MASGSVVGEVGGGGGGGGGGNDGGGREKQRYSECKVYTRRSFKANRKDSISKSIAAATTTLTVPNSNETARAAPVVSSTAGEERSLAANAVVLSDGKEGNNEKIDGDKIIEVPEQQSVVALDEPKQSGPRVEVMSNASSGQTEPQVLVPAVAAPPRTGGRESPAVAVATETGGVKSPAANVLEGTSGLESPAATELPGIAGRKSPAATVSTEPGGVVSQPVSVLEGTEGRNSPAAAVVSTGGQESSDAAGLGGHESSIAAIAANSVEQELPAAGAAVETGRQESPAPAALAGVSGQQSPVVAVTGVRGGEEAPPAAAAAAAPVGTGGRESQVAEPLSGPSLQELSVPTVLTGTGGQEAPAAAAVPVRADQQESLAAGNGAVKERIDRVKINVVSKSKQEARELRRKLERDLEIVRGLVKKIEAKEAQLGIGGISSLRVTVNNTLGNGLRRVNSEVGSVSVPRESTLPIPTPTPRQSRPLNHLSVSVLENSQGLGEIVVEKEKRTPKANQFYRNSEFLLAKDKFPPAESNKKSKSNGKKHGKGDSGRGFRPGTKIFKNCSGLLEKLMKHRHGWVFNTPVDVEALGLHDYFTIIKHPMDLGTVKTRLSKNWYKSPEEFAEDVRLTFHNALRYNPKGQDVHVMAEQLLMIFEDRWAVIMSDYDRGMMFSAGYAMGVPTPTSRKAPMTLPHLDMSMILDRSDSMTYPVFNTRPRPISTTPSSRTPAPKKPKAKDPNKRDMTYEEKQKLSTNLQSLPSDKLDNIVHIIKKRNSALSQHEDEIEVDIDSVDTETLWELDRFVTNYKKSLSKNKRKAELASQARAEAERNIIEKNPAPVIAEDPKEKKSAEGNVSAASPVQQEKQGDNGSRSSSSSSSSSDSGSSSSGSDSDSSSASESDVGH